MSGLSLFTSDCNTDLSFLQETEQTPSTPSLGTFSGGKSILDDGKNAHFLSPRECFCVNPEGAVASTLVARDAGGTSILDPALGRLGCELQPDVKPFPVSMLLALSSCRGVKIQTANSHN